MYDEIGEILSRWPRPLMPFPLVIMIRNVKLLFEEGKWQLQKAMVDIQFSKMSCFYSKFASVYGKFLEHIWKDLGAAGQKTSNVTTEGGDNQCVSW